MLLEAGTTCQLPTPGFTPRVFCGVTVAPLFSFLCCAFCFVCLRPVYPMLPVSLDCAFFIDPSVFHNV